ncbi:Crp/Fnr family transcriptional regulator [Rossellomorea sp. SC111]|uniref:Crp/Fnr family transcriptional regulator n=1 Tax=Rossellomorea sp. SC111 TaxID=2968985 RepID=UPI00215A45EF|nr:Crp/Fnr family transcriptional regulator [Rossellomorea sp. SC111]MCR8847708.1 Crp/Fnr family transcriptional regulator [Rossellomorea sp. SC111]
MNSSTPLQSTAILEELSERLVNYSKKEVIFQPFSLDKHLYMIHSGKIKLYKNSEDGRKTILIVLGEGEIFSNIPSFSLDEEGVYAETIDPTILHVLSHKRVESMKGTHSLTVTELYSTLNQQMKMRNLFIESIMYTPVKERILFLLSFLMKRFGEKQGNLIKINVHLTHQDIASFIGSTRETVTSLTKELIKEGYIQKINRNYHMVKGTDLS